MGFRRRRRRRALIERWAARRSLITMARSADSSRTRQAPADDQAPADGGQDPAQYAPPPADPADEIEHLAQLHASGVLTDEEFAAAKAKTLGIMNAARIARRLRTDEPMNHGGTGDAMSQSRKDVLLKALEAEVGGAPVDPRTLFTEDVVGWSPIAHRIRAGGSSLHLAALREEAFSNVVIMFRGLDEVGNKAFAEWVIEADHTGPLVLGEECRVGSNRTACPVGRRHRGRLPRWKDPVIPDVLRRRSPHRTDRRRLTSRSLWSSTSRTIPIRSTSKSLKRRSVVRRPPLWGSATNVDLAIFVRDGGTVVAGISGWTWGDCCELQNLWVDPSLRGQGLALLDSSPPPKLRRRLAGAHRPSTSPTTFRLDLSMSGRGTNWWVESRTSHRGRTFCGTASALKARADRR